MDKPEREKRKTVFDAYDFNPLAWGILFFIFWLTLVALPFELNLGQKIMAWSAFIISGVLWLSIIVRPLREVMKNQRVKQVYLPIVFFISIGGYTISWVSSLQGMILSNVPFAVYGGFIWLLTYILILVGSSSKKVGIFGSLLFVITGVYSLIQANILGGGILLCFGVILLLIAIIRPSWLWYESII
ncbi:hypothetical protein ACFLTZ_02020 [Chloroflexota bacterium]